ncbi:hypothetical protein E1B28_005455 [Marasmius oreades]|uniref:Uncharacterized protein n=1 Tax=Marasmius oreades TaxID=181124 RepID=A0A9P7S375_9AGAR|nr:uncharacterized protein E1B28_005455 [Marasmius oreades]KAG7094631.1 hypothetical protein E1B28_005455 [Marasmius oreades]
MAAAEGDERTNLLNKLVVSCVWMPVKHHRTSSLFRDRSFQDNNFFALFSLVYPRRKTDNEKGYEICRQDIYIKPDLDGRVLAAKVICFIFDRHRDLFTDQFHVRWSKLVVRLDASSVHSEKGVDHGTNTHRSGDSDDDDTYIDVPILLTPFIYELPGPGKLKSRTRLVENRSL